MTKGQNITHKISERLQESLGDGIFTSNKKYYSKFPVMKQVERFSTDNLIKHAILYVYGCFSFCLLVCNSNILFNRTNIFRDKTSFCQFLTWLLPGLKKMLILIISNTEGVKVLVCPAIFWDIRWVSGTNLPMFTYGRCCCHFL